MGFSLYKIFQSCQVLSDYVDKNVDITEFPTRAEMTTKNITFATSEYSVLLFSGFLITTFRNDRWEQPYSIYWQEIASLELLCGSKRNDGY